MISTSHIVIMLISIFALNFSNMVQCGTFETNTGIIKGIKDIKISKIINIRHVTLAILFFILLASRNLIVLSTLSAVFFCSILLEFGHRDPRHAAHKTATFFIIASVFLGISANVTLHAVSSLLLAISFNMLLTSYPFNSWAEPFFMRAPFLLTSFLLIIWRPLVVSIFLYHFQKHNLTICLESYITKIAIVLSLFFVPILFFAKTNIKRLAASMICWQSGYLLIFLTQLNQQKQNLIILMAITQGIFTSIVSHVAHSLEKKYDNDTISNLEGLFKSDYFLATFMISALIFLILIPIVFAYRNGTAILQTKQAVVVLSSIILPSIFCYKIYKIMAQKTYTDTNQ